LKTEASHNSKGEGACFISGWVVAVSGDMQTKETPRSTLPEFRQAMLFTEVQVQPLIFFFLLSSLN
jgi:hypothetical protein